MIEYNTGDTLNKEKIQRIKYILKGKQFIV